MVNMTFTLICSFAVTNGLISNRRERARVCVDYQTKQTDGNTQAYSLA